MSYRLEPLVCTESVNAVQIGSLRWPRAEDNEILLPLYWLLNHQRSYLVPFTVATFHRHHLAIHYNLNQFRVSAYCLAVPHLKNIYSGSCKQASHGDVRSLSYDVLSHALGEYSYQSRRVHLQDGKTVWSKLF